MTYRIFISFATGDDEFVTQLNQSISLLENVEVYIPNWLQDEGKNMDYKVKEGLDSSHVVIVLMTFNSTNTIWLNQQIGYAFAKNIPIILMVEKGIDVRGFLERHDFITYHRGNFKLNTHQILSKLRILYPQYLFELPIENFYVTCPTCNKKFLEPLPTSDILSQKVERGMALTYLCQFCSIPINIDSSTLSPLIQ